MKNHALPLLSALIVLLIVPGTLQAHGLSSTEPEPGKVKFTFDDGHPVANGYVGVYDKDGREIATGQADAEGMYDFSSHEGAVKISIADVHGHHLEHVIGGGGRDHSANHDHEHAHGLDEKTTMVLIVAALLLAASGIFYLAGRKRQPPPLK